MLTYLQIRELGPLGLIKELHVAQHIGGVNRCGALQKIKALKAFWASPSELLGLI